MEEYQIALTPDLGLRPADFVNAWNEGAETRTNGEAQLASATSREYDAGLVGEIVLSLTTGIVGNALYELIKGVLMKKGVQKHIHIEERKKPDGTRLLLVDIDEK